MRLGNFIKEYRQEHGISLRGFAAKCNLSQTYVASIEKGVGSTGKTVKPTLSVYKAVAAATGITLNELLSICEDDTVIINEKAPPDEREMLIQKLADKLSHMSPEQIQELLRYAQYIQSRQEEP